MKRLLLASLIGSFALAAVAQDRATAPPAEANVDAQVQVETETEVDTRLDRRTQVQRDADRDCIRYTGSRITTRQMRDNDKDCVIVNGRVYSREDLDRTGEVDIAEALRKLDPAIY